MRDAVQVAVRDLLEVDIDKSLIKINGTTLYLNIGSVVKSAVFENKTNILARVNNVLGKEQITDLK